jgi:hypothetical protein
MVILSSSLKAISPELLEAARSTERASWRCSGWSSCRCCCRRSP